jgi:hypothetical protein
MPHPPSPFSSPHISSHINPHRITIFIGLIKNHRYLLTSTLTFHTLHISAHNSIHQHNTTQHNTTPYQSIANHCKCIYPFIIYSYVSCYNASFPSPSSHSISSLIIAILTNHSIHSIHQHTITLHDTCYMLHILFINISTHSIHPTHSNSTLLLLLSLLPCVHLISCITNCTHH